MSKECACIHFNNGKCKKFSDDKVTSWCFEGSCEDITPSNADRIRAMSDEQLARWLDNFFWGSCKNVRLFNLLKWLKQPVEE